jgi:uncharacterized membrane-anchored protein YitT (DUF2179 family)
MNNTSVSKEHLPSQHKKITRMKALRRAFFMFVGSILFSVGLEIFLVPNNIIDGGIVGISIILSHLLHIPLGVFLILLNLPFLLIGYKQIGKTFAMSTLFSVIIMSIGSTLLHPDQSKSVWIISDEFEKIGDAITSRLGRGVTYLHGEGGSF